MRIGFGFDAHELVNAKPLKLGGITVDFPKGLQGHSDGDVLLHSLADAILGACAGGDIGMFFRDNDQNIKGIDSKEILNFALKTAHASNLSLTSIDIVVVADKPKLNTLYNSLRESISGLCNIPPQRVSVKSKTTEGTTVNEDAIACYSVVLMEEL